ncbi:restriction endonuclease [Hydrogenovibrio crunogenus]|uniref:Restriction endonuclease n=2 Tax=Hydrogenovibrio crunogenus TaxID=39765 RepID=A0A4P7NZI1_9GAMM|nr:restriction endonuclease [Hydrogenovibrio crunogenus]
MWRQYEWLISKIFHDNTSSLTTKILNDTRVVGEYSERSRQVDILIKTKTQTTMVECKHYSVPVDIKSVESFLGMVTDVKVDYGILVSSSGYTKSAEKRIRGLKDKISLENIDWETAYETAFEEVSYGRISDVCAHCVDRYESGREVPGLLCWEHGFALEYQGTVSEFSISKCLKCNKYTAYCDACGLVTPIEKNDICCDLASQFISWYKDTYQ